MKQWTCIYCIETMDEAIKEYHLRKKYHERHAYQWFKNYSLTLKEEKEKTM